jgi:hypothetical protein
VVAMEEWAARVLMAQELVEDAVVCSVVANF